MLFGMLALFWGLDSGTIHFTSGKLTLNARHRLLPASGVTLRFRRVAKTNISFGSFSCFFIIIINSCFICFGYIFRIKLFLGRLCINPGLTKTNDRACVFKHCFFYAYICTTSCLIGG